MKDKFGRELQVGDTVLRAYRVSTVVNLELRTVERIADGHVYLNGSKGSNVTNFSNLAKVDPAWFGEFR